MTETGQQQPFNQRSDWWSRRPRRSRANSKIAGVAGGLGRYLGVDPVLFRVGFVVLTVLGGAGILAYCLCWLLLPLDGDEVSAGESLLGRGRSSVSPILAVGLAIAVLISITSSFSWGLPFWPVAIAAVIAFHIARKQRRGPFRPGSVWGQQNPGQWGQGQRNQTPTDPNQQGHPGWGSWGQWGGKGCGPQQRQGAESTAQPFNWAKPGASAGTSTGSAADAGQPSPFDTPAFWDQGSAGGTGSTGNDTAGFAEPGASAGYRSTADPVAPPPRTTPPAWDPLGAAPFAWDLPDIDVAPKSTLVQTRRPAPVIYRAAFGLAMLVAAVQVAGIFAGWWLLTWAAVAASALVVVALGLLVQALLGRRITLLAPGIVLAVITVALTLTGMSGTTDVGNQAWTPTSATALQSEYHVSAGQAKLDLSGLTLERGTTVTTSVHVEAGQAMVLLPEKVNLNVTCSSNVGSVDCVGNRIDGFDNDETFVDTIESGGTINLDVHVGAGDLLVSRG